MRKPTHPGAILREDVLPELGMNISEFAQQSGISRPNVSKIVNEKRGITPEVAFKLGKFLKSDGKIWLLMQLEYDYYIKKQELENPDV